MQKSTDRRLTQPVPIGVGLICEKNTSYPHVIQHTLPPVLWEYLSSERSELTVQICDEIFGRESRVQRDIAAKT